MSSHFWKVYMYLKHTSSKQFDEESKVRKVASQKVILKAIGIMEKLTFLFYEQNAINAE